METAIDTLFKNYIEQDEKEKKRSEQLEHKKELQRLADEEMSSLKGKERVVPTNKVTRAQIQANQEQLAAEGNFGACLWKFQQLPSVVACLVFNVCALFKAVFLSRHSFLPVTCTVIQQYFLSHYSRISVTRLNYATCQSIRL